MLKILSLLALPFLLLSPAPVMQPGVPILGVTNLTEGMTVTLEVSNCAAGDSVLIAASLNGGGPMTTPFGIADLTPPLRQTPLMTANSFGIAAAQKPLPMGSAGVSIWFHAANVSSGELSNSLALVIAAKPPPVEILAVTGGSFSMGDHAGLGGVEELPLHTVRINDLWMDKFEVNNESYAQYLNQAQANGEIEVANDVVSLLGTGYGLCDLASALSESKITWNGTTFSVTPGFETHPMAEVSWYGACTYANWRSLLIGRTPCYNVITWECNFAADGCRLPTEAEREYAMRGDTPTYTTYPWGNTFDGSNANYHNSGDPWDNSTTPVGYYDGNQIPAGGDMANGFGLYDTAGNIYEWCQDWYDAAYYSVSPAVNPIGPSTGSFRVMRGGSWNSGSYYIRSACRSYGAPMTRNAGIGFRLVEVHP